MAHAITTVQDIQDYASLIFSETRCIVHCAFGVIMTDNNKRHSVSHPATRWRSSGDVLTICQTTGRLRQPFRPSQSCTSVRLFSSL